MHKTDGVGKWSITAKRLKQITFGMLFALLLAAGPAVPAYAQEQEQKQELQKNILILHSYTHSLSWTRDESDGILDVLNASQRNLSIYEEYMDWKNFPNPENLRNLEQNFLYKYRQRMLDLIITTDDAALQFALEHRKTLFSDAPVVFSAVNEQSAAELTKGYANFTGVLESVDPTETITAALALNPELKTVYVLYDNSESGISTGMMVMDKIGSRFTGLQAVSLNDLTYGEILRKAAAMDKNSIILITTFSSDAEGYTLNYERITREISEKSSVPVYSLYTMGLGNGSLGGSMLSGRLHGESAAGLALRVLDGEAVDSIKVPASDSIRNAMDYRQLKRFGLPLEKVPSNFTVVNKPFSFFETYKYLVLEVAAVFCLLVALLLILSVYIRKTGKMRKELSENNEELTQTYEELTASQEELQMQYDEIVAGSNKIREAEERYYTLAYYDTLTGLPNRMTLFEHLESRALTREEYALLFIDIDNFKYINDTMGHTFGDQLIIHACNRLKSLLIEGCTIYRLSGDEFILICSGLLDKTEVENFVSGIIAGFKEEFRIQNSNLHISLSIGVALYPEHGKDIDEMIKNADIAMYRAKEKGKNGWAWYDDQLNQAFVERVVIEEQLYKALERNEIYINYQPQLNLKTNRIDSLEALLRWKNPVLGQVPPAVFIKVAEDTHLILSLGTWVLQKACTFLKEMHNEGHEQLQISVNISVLQLVQENFVELVMETLEQVGLEPQDLELEITESVLMESFGTICPKLEELRRRGVRIALDDFGKGYSSLSYLKQLPITTIKIDKQFIDSVVVDIEEDNLTRHIISIGKSLGMWVVAEGVERQEQMEYLLYTGCNRIQGYLFSKPVAGEDIRLILQNGGHGSMYFDWKDLYSVNVRVIDEQHRKLFELGGRIAELVMLKDGVDRYDEIMAVFEELKEYTLHHFEYEEKLMKQANFPDADLHELEHFFLVKKLDKLQKQDIDSKQSEVVTDLVAFLSDWISGHILQTDMKYKDFFNKAGIL